ncbi:hypothetical protein HP532_17435 [Pseudomonas sp. CrR25]|nr:hypothetical protein [Pseudomonas sp. CrR25]
MDTKDQQLAQLLSLITRSMTHLTAALAEMSFELMRSSEQPSHRAGQRMIDHLSVISSELDQQWALIGTLTGQPISEEKADLLVEVEMDAPLAER